MATPDSKIVVFQCIDSLKKLKKENSGLQVLKLKNEDVLSHTRVCLRHFKDGNPNNSPQLNIGKWFASPIKQAKIRENIRSVSLFTKESQQTSSSRSTPNENRDGPRKVKNDSIFSQRRASKHLVPGVHQMCQLKSVKTKCVMNL